MSQCWCYEGFKRKGAWWTLLMPGFHVATATLQCDVRFEYILSRIHPRRGVLDEANRRVLGLSLKAIDTFSNNEHRIQWLGGLDKIRFDLFLGLAKEKFTFFNWIIEDHRLLVLSQSRIEDEGEKLCRIKDQGSKRSCRSNKSIALLRSREGDIGKVFFFFFTRTFRCPNCNKVFKNWFLFFLHNFWSSESENFTSLTPLKVYFFLWSNTCWR